MPLTRLSEEQALSAEARADLYARHTEASRLTPRSAEIDAVWRGLYNTPTRDELVSALRAMSDGKCAYCECVDPRDVEHFYPKSRHPERMFRWDNLLFVCKTCNLDKTSRFPLEGTQALLIEPSAEDPARFFWWDPVTGRPLLDSEPTRRRRAEETIKILPRLKHQDLAEERRKLRLDVLFFLTEVLEEVPRPPDVVARLATLLSPTQPWRSVLRQLVSEEPTVIAAVRARAPELAPLLDALPPMPPRPLAPLPPAP
ncbi:MAG: TIGR02646 family protein [Deltaproteobacteria bacterium]|nr:TIGR02646 family protein [Deltaproteobacteria bacterium]